MELCNIVQGDTKAVSVIVLYGIDIAYLFKVVKILNYSQVWLFSQPDQLHTFCVTRNLRPELMEPEPQEDA